MGHDACVTMRWYCEKASRNRRGDDVRSVTCRQEESKEVDVDVGLDWSTVSVGGRRMKERSVRIFR